jgi:hypothetical protein
MNLKSDPRIFEKLQATAQGIVESLSLAMWTSADNHRDKAQQMLLKIETDSLKLARLAEAARLGIMLTKRKES